MRHFSKVGEVGDGTTVRMVPLQDRQIFFIMETLMASLELVRGVGAPLGLASGEAVEANRKMALGVARQMMRAQMGVEAAEEVEAAAEKLTGIPFNEWMGE